MATASKYKLSFKRMGLSAYLALLLVILLAMPFTVLAKEVGEYHIKAVFLCNLTPFVNWPAHDNAQQDSERKYFIIGIYGPDPFKSLLDKVVAGEKKGEKQVKVERYQDLNQLDPTKFDILFLHSSTLDQWPEILQSLSGFPVLTVADVKGFPEKGGMVNLLKTRKKIQVEINLEAVQRAGLSVSSKLLNLARIIE